MPVTGTQEALELQGTIDASFATFVRIEHQDDLGYESTDLANVGFIQGSPHGGDDLSDPILMGHHDVGVAFDDGQVTHTRAGMSSEV